MKVILGILSATALPIYRLNSGFSDAGDFLNNRLIDSHDHLAGFNTIVVRGVKARFQLANAPTQENCSVSYLNAWFGAGKITINTTQWMLNWWHHGVNRDYVD